MQNIFKFWLRFFICSVQGRALVLAGRVESRLTGRLRQPGPSQIFNLPALLPSLQPCILYLPLSPLLHFPPPRRDGPVATSSAFRGRGIPAIAPMTIKVRQQNILLRGRRNLGFRGRRCQRWPAGEPRTLRAVRRRALAAHEPSSVGQNAIVREHRKGASIRGFGGLVSRCWLSPEMRWRRCLIDQRLQLLKSSSRVSPVYVHVEPEEHWHNVVIDHAEVGGKPILGVTTISAEQREEIDCTLQV
mmetsp:Transcript_156402/g.291908  ORF Transcript_156402/g.291908 Transcript_156402/m.291908 type:complete len:245 (-) Transcript_156402:723-1457(-)